MRRAFTPPQQSQPLASLQKEPDLTRPEAIRRLVDLGLKVKAK
jgi:hypothetical protein